MTSPGVRHGNRMPIRPLGNLREVDAAELAERICRRIGNSSARQALVWISTDGGVVVSPEGSSSTLYATADNIVGFYQVPRRSSAAAGLRDAIAADLLAAASHLQREVSA